MWYSFNLYLFFTLIIIIDLNFKIYIFRELQLPESCLNNKDDVEVKGFKFDSLTEELREKRYHNLLTVS
jgi:hypothetical protein